MGFLPVGPGRDFGRYQKELYAPVVAFDSPAPWLRPNRAGLVIPPCHGIHKQRAIVPERVRDPVDSPVVHETGVADRSPRDEYGKSSQLVIHHLSEAQYGDWIGLGLPFDRHADNELFVK